jgi:plasmid stabilization system protein ParE
MRITYLSLAVLDFAEIRAYIAAENPEAAQRVGSKLRESIHGLERFPNLGKPGRVFGTREMNTPKVGKTTYAVV